MIKSLTRDQEAYLFEAAQNPELKRILRDELQQLQTSIINLGFCGDITEFIVEHQRFLAKIEFIRELLGILDETVQNIQQPTVKE